MGLRLERLAAELVALPSAFDPRHRGLLDRLNLPTDLALHMSDLRLVRIKPDGDFFEFDEFGVPALIVLVFDGLGPCFVAPVDRPPLIDFVAVPVSEPTRWYLRIGVATYLGEDRIRSALTWRTTLVVHATPIDWLRAHCTGCCPLTDDYLALRDAPVLQIDDRDFAVKVGEQLRRPFPIPRILVPTRIET